MSFEASSDTSLNQTSIVKPTLSFMALHCKNVRSTRMNFQKQYDGTQPTTVCGRHPRIKSIVMKRNARDVSGPHFSEHILDRPLAELAVDDEVYEINTATGDGYISSSSKSSTSPYTDIKHGLDTLNPNLEQRKVNHDPHPTSHLCAESPIEKHFSDTHASSDPNVIPFSSEYLDNKMDTIEIVSTANKYEMSSETLDDRHPSWEYRHEFRPGNSTSSNDQIDQSGMHFLVLEAMKTVQRYELENEKQKQELNRLGTVIADLQFEKRHLGDKLTTLKTTISQKVAANCQILKGQREELHALKSNSRGLFATGECKALLEEIRQFKNAISESIQSAQEYLAPEKCLQNSDSIVLSKLTTRELLSVLKNEVDIKQQVSDMLRDRLTDALSDVTALRTHTFQIQEAYSAARVALKLASEKRDMQDARISELLAELNTQQAELLKALTQAAELEIKLKNQQQRESELDNLRKTLEVEIDLRRLVEKRVIEQDAIIQTQKTSLELLERITNENLQLSSELASRTERLKSLENSQTTIKTLSDENERLKNEVIIRESARREHEIKLVTLEEFIAKSIKDLEEQKSTIHDFTNSIYSNNVSIAELKHLVLNSHEKLAQSESLVAQTQKDLLAFSHKTTVLAESEKILQAHCFEVTKQKEALIVQLKETSHELSQVLASKDQETNNQLKSFREQIEDQSTTLRLVREANADLQERLLSVIADHTKKLEESRGNFRKDIAILEERNTSLHTQLEREKESVTQLRASLSQKEQEIGKYIKESKERCESYLGLHQNLRVLEEQKSSLEIQLHQDKATYKVQYAEFQVKEAERLREIDELHTDLGLRTRYELEMKERHDREQLDNRSQVELLQNRLSDLEKNSSLPYNCFEHEQEIHRLRAHVHQIQAESEMVRKRMITLSLRYDSGDLDVTERSLVQKIMKRIQAVHDQELAKLKNELHRKDGLIANLEDIKTTLENSLRKTIQKKSPATEKKIFEPSEYINWPSSLSSPRVDELPTKTSPTEHQNAIVRYRQPGTKSSPLNMAPDTMPQTSNDNLDSEPPADKPTQGSGIETPQLTKRPKCTGRNTQTYSSRNKRKRR